MIEDRMKRVINSGIMPIGKQRLVGNQSRLKILDHPHRL